MGAAGTSQGAGGNPFDAGSCDQGISKLEIWSGCYVDAIRVTWRNGACSGKRGGTGGTHYAIDLQPGEQITRIDKWHAGLVDAIQVTTNKKQHPKLGGTGGSKTSYVIPSGNLVTSITGRSGKYLDALEIKHSGDNKIMNFQVGLKALHSMQGGGKGSIKHTIRMKKGVSSNVEIGAEVWAELKNKAEAGLQAKVFKASNSTEATVGGKLRSLASWSKTAEYEEELELTLDLSTAQYIYQAEMTFDLNGISVTVGGLGTASFSKPI